ncbi:MAG: deoxyribonuclease V [Nitrospirae bacterium]|nr:deoxyribonuclease V [Nitrospirota bacterium]
MRPVPDNLWPKDIQTARMVQETLAQRVSIRPLKRNPKLIAGVDACFTDKSVVAAASLYSYPALEFLGDAIAKDRMRFPYVPGYLSFREGPAIIKALRKLKTQPDVVLFDGQGIAHPRGMGIASHIGVVLDIPSIGCAKSRLIGEFAEPGPRRGNWSPLYYQGRQVGTVLRTRDRVRPLFISPGHRIDLGTCIDIVMHAVTSCRLPEPIRRADHLSRLTARKGAEDED